jgi:hypothetical protein
MYLAHMVLMINTHDVALVETRHTTDIFLLFCIVLVFFSIKMKEEDGSSFES